MSEQTDKPQINVVEMVHFASTVIHNAFVNNNKDNVKKVLTDLKKNKPIEIGTIKVAEDMTIPMFLELNNRDWVGPGFNATALHFASKALVDNIRGRLEKKEDLNLMKGDNGSILVNLPGVIEKDGQHNVLVLTFDLSKQGKIVMTMLFMDPTQFVRKEEE